MKRGKKCITESYRIKAVPPGNWKDEKERRKAE
jgi:hypothetical protein